MKVAIFGAVGTIGRSVTAALLARGDTVRVVARTETNLRDAFGGSNGVEIVPADLSTAEGCARAASGADAIVYAVGLPYTRAAFSAYPSMMHLAVTAARTAGVRRLLQIANVYSYGLPHTPRVREDHPREPVAVKGRWRKEQEDVTLACHGASGLETLVLRLPDFYGPFADRSLGNMILSAAAHGGRANMIGPIDTPHEFVFTPDVGPLVAALLSHATGWGEAYNFAGVGIITQRAFAMRAFAMAERRPRLRVASPRLVRMTGIFSPLMRELVEMTYLQTHPVLLDDSKLRALLGTVGKTSYEEGIQRTLQQLRVRAAA
ncbi:MAG TPA: NAD(P)H-binding protein [Vicinamibacterales bacterium]|nr:NAD(P)H-binding protein [Vicinamibacterales bacterium]